MMYDLAAIEADLVSAHALGGDAGLHAQVLEKFAALDMDYEDLESVLDAVKDEFDSQRHKYARLGSGASAALALAPLMAAPLITAGKMVMNNVAKDKAWKEFQMYGMDLLRQDYDRTKSLFDLVYSTAPEIAKQPRVMIDIIRQLMAAPMVDLGTIGNLASTGRAMTPTGPDAGAVLQGGANLAGAIPAATQQPEPKVSSATIKANHVCEDGTPTFFNWGTEACKEAGITDAFVGSGTSMEQADQGSMMTQMDAGNTLLPLDNVVRELLAKEQELMTREDLVSQQEMQLQEAMQQLQATQQQYMQMTGMDPSMAGGMDGGQGYAAPEMPPEPSMGGEEMLPEAMGGEELPPEGEELPPEGEELSPEGEELSPEGEELPPEGEELPPEGEELPPEEEELPPEGEELPPEEEGGEIPPGEEGELPAEEGDGELPPTEEEEDAEAEGEAPTAADLAAGDHPEDGDDDGAIDIDGDGDEDTIPPQSLAGGVEMGAPLPVEEEEEEGEAGPTPEEEEQEVAMGLETPEQAQQELETGEELEGHDQEAEDAAMEGGPTGEEDVVPAGAGGIPQELLLEHAQAAGGPDIGGDMAAQDVGEVMPGGEPAVDVQPGPEGETEVTLPLRISIKVGENQVYDERRQALEDFNRTLTESFRE